MAIYCDDKCRDCSWNEFHKWECVGMQTRLWYDIGIAFPAWRTVVKGIKSGFSESLDSRESDLDHYGDINDNYVYFNKLESNFSRLAIVQTLAIVRQPKTYCFILDFVLTKNVALLVVCCCNCELS